MNDLSAYASRLNEFGHTAPEFVAEFYRNTQADLRSFSDEQLIAHYKEYGRKEGRCATPADYRAGFVGQIAHSGLVLEIGPAVRPTLVGENVRYFEIADRAGLIDRATREGYDYSRCPEVIHYVSETADLTSVADRFDAVLSSHCVEHQPDLILHLQNVARLLKPGGRYYLLIPDKRYCFDALLPESDIGRVRRAHAERRTVHAFDSVLEHAAMTTHNAAERHWRGDHVDLPLVAQQAERVARARRMFEEAAGSYIDVHAWQFTPDSFRATISQLADVVPFQIERVYNTLRDRNEFGAILTSRSRG